MSARTQDSSLWIQGPVQDFVLFIGSPLLLLPAYLAASRLWAVADIYTFVIAFGALGHHLPGMMRAYGDRELFSRFATRFIVAPIFLVLITTYFVFTEPAVMMLVAFGWGLWHALMQTYGFLRIYDAKNHSFGAATAYLDRSMCIAWFFLAFLYAPNRLHMVLDYFYKGGGFVVPPYFVHQFRFFWTGLTIVVTIAFFINLFHTWRAGRPQSPIKLLLLATSVGFFWYTSATIPNLLGGILLFEAFHDIQYVAITWLYNRKRVTGHATVGRFSRYLFRRSGFLIVIYVGLIVAYGSPPILFKSLGVTAWPFQELLQVLTVASALLHFYYDGFIWKIREKSTSDALGLEGHQAIRPARTFPSWSRHGLKWAFLVIPIAALGVAHARGPMPEYDRMRVLADTFPDIGEAQYGLGIVNYYEGDLESAVQATRQAVALEPANRKFQDNLVAGLLELAEARFETGDYEQARSMLMEAYRYNPSLPDHLFGQAAELEKRNDPAGAIREYRLVLLLSPNRVEVHIRLALVLQALGERDAALEHAHRARGLRPDDPALSALVDELQAAR